MVAVRPGEKGESQRWRRIGVLGLAAFALLTCFVGLRDGPAMGDHECINALAARQALESGRWLIPYLGEVPRIRKTPLGIWLIAASSSVVDGATASTPVTEFSARLPSACAAFGTVMLVCWLGRQMFGYRAGLTAAFVSAGCVATILYAHSAQVDMVLTFFTTMSFALFWRGALHESRSRWCMAAFYVAFALAMTAKAPLPLATVGLSLAVYWFAAVPAWAAAENRGSSAGPVLRRLGNGVWRQFRRLPELGVVPGGILFLLVAGAWPAYVYAHIDQALSLWRIEYLDRFSGEMTDRSWPVLYYIPILFGLVAPYMVSLPEAVAAPFLNRYRAYRKGLALAFTWAVVGTCFLSAAAFKRPHYLLSLIPAYCLLLGPVIDRLFFREVPVTGRRVQLTYRMLPLLLAVGAIAGGVALHRQYADLLSGYVWGMSLALVLWTAACWAYARGRRVISFAQLHLGVAALLLVCWPAMGARLEINPEAQALVRSLAAHNVRPDDLIFWVSGRPDSSVEFYSGFHVRPLIDELEMALMWPHRRSYSTRLHEEFLRRIRRRLGGARPAYLILTSEHLEMLKANTPIGHRVLFRLDGFQQRPDDELVVITQPE